MTRDEAQNILELIRPGRPEDREDPLVRQALGVMEDDADLRARFEDALETDRRISCGFASIEVPAGLEASILVGMRAHAAAAAAPGRLEAPEPSRSIDWWRRPWVAAAACLVVILGLALTVRPGDTGPGGTAVTQAGLPSFIPFLSREIARFDSYDRTGRDAAELRSFLAERGNPSPATLPGKLRSLPTLGCITFQFGGADFSMICFKNGKVYHLLTANLDDLDEPAPDAPEVFEYDGQVFRVWAENGQLMILTCRGSREELAEVI